MAALAAARPRPGRPGHRGARRVPAHARPGRRLLRDRRRRPGELGAPRPRGRPAPARAGARTTPSCWPSGLTELRPEEAADYLAARVEQYAALAPDDPSSARPRGGGPAARPPPRRTPVGRAGRGARAPAHPQPQRPAREQRLRRRRPAAVLRLRRRAGHRAARGPADPAQHPRREARRRRRRRAAVAGRRRGARGVERPGADAPSCGQPCRLPSSSGGWAGSSRGCAASRRCPTPSSRSGARWPRPGSARSTPSRRSAGADRPRQQAARGWTPR